MLKLFAASAELALPLCLLAAVLIANRSYAPTVRRRVGRLAAGGLGAGLLAAVVIVWLRLTTSLVRLPAVNLWTGSLLLVVQLVFLVALWLPSTRVLVTHDLGRANHLLTGSAVAGLALVGLYHGIPLAMASDAVVPMNASLYDSASVLNLAGYVLGIAAVAIAAGTSAVSLGRVPALARRLLTTLVVAIALVAEGVPLYQQFASAKLVPRNSLNFNTLLWIERNSVVILLVQTALAVLPAVVALVRRTRAAAPDASAAERRLVRAA
ncbi:MAG: hypothetical protein QM633_10550, partial [Propionicimonas sp.]